MIILMIFIIIIIIYFYRRDDDRIMIIVVVKMMMIMLLLALYIFFYRCKLVAFLLKDMDTISSSSSNSSSNDSNNNINNNHSVLMEYLKQLPPSAIDLEFRALYIYDGDEEGIMLLQQFLQWITIHIQSGENFEILQAYLYRILIIYSDIIIKLSSFKLVLSKLYQIHYNSSIRFRNLIQKNLCLLKMLANLPIT